MINTSLFDEIQKSNSKILIVTKYWDNKTTNKIIKEIYKNYTDIIFWIWENRIESIIQKDIDRKDMHFIWNIQSKKIEKIVTFCSIIHSLQSLKHAKLINKYSKKLQITTKVFLQIKLDLQKPIWLTEIELQKLIKEIKNLDNIKILWLSGMWVWVFTKEEKQEEFNLLKSLRDKYLPWKLISAWTSRDYKIALENDIEIVRIGSKILKV